jgi:hypothetical protein
LKSKHLIALFASIILIVLLATSCTPTATQPGATTTATQPTVTVTATPTTKVEYRETIYRALNPRGIEPPVDCKALAPRLDTLDGKTIQVTIAEADPIIAGPLGERLLKDNPKSTWKTEWVQTFGPSAPTEAMLKADAVILGIGW